MIQVNSKVYYNSKNDEKNNKDNYHNSIEEEDSNAKIDSTTNDISVRNQSKIILDIWLISTKEYQVRCLKKMG